MTFDVELRNAGRTPNQGLGFRIAVVDDAHWRFAEASLCKRGGGSARRAADADSWKADAGRSIVPGDVVQFDKVVPETIRLDASPRLVGCITYKWNGEIHQTGFFSRLVKKPDGGISVTEIYAIDPD